MNIIKRLSSAPLRLDGSLREGLRKTGYEGPETLGAIIKHFESLDMCFFLFPERRTVTEEDVLEGMNPDMEGESVRPDVLDGNTRYAIEAYVPIPSGTGHIPTPLVACATAEDLPVQFREKILLYLIDRVNNPGLSCEE